MEQLGTCDVCSVVSTELSVLQQRKHTCSLLLTVTAVIENVLCVKNLNLNHQ